MNITIKATGCELSEATREFVEGKLGALRKHTGAHADTALLACEVEESIGVVRAGARYRAGATLSVDGRIFRGEAVSETLEGAVDLVRDELIREVAKVRGKQRSLLKRGGARIKRLFWGNRG